MALPDACNSQDRLLTIDINSEIDLPSDLPGSTIKSMFLDREDGVLTPYGTFQPGIVLPTHFHTGAVRFFTTKGRWHCAEYTEDVKTANSCLYGSGGSIHTFMVPTDATEGFMVANGANVNFVNGEYYSIIDTCAIEDGFLGAVKAGLIPMPRYVRPKGGAQFSTT
jgi:2,4'-dihydroxyacetophenone dioxygenase